MAKAAQPEDRPVFPVVDEHAALAARAARGERRVAVEQVAIGVDRLEMGVDGLQVESRIGDDPIEAGHQVGLGHRRISRSDSTSSRPSSTSDRRSRCQGECSTAWRTISRSRSSRWRPGARPTSRVARSDPARAASRRRRDVASVPRNRACPGPSHRFVPVGASGYDGKAGFGSRLRDEYGIRYGLCSRKPQLPGPAYQLKLGVDAELRVDAGQVALDGAFPHEQRPGDLPRAHPGRGQPRDLALAAGERAGPERGRGGAAAGAAEVLAAASPRAPTAPAPAV